MGRWTQYDGDDYRLPEGMKRVGYDADSQQYTFKDTATGELYHGEPRSEYGTLYPIESTVESLMSDSDVPPMIPKRPSIDVKSFSDILPDSKIASPSTAQSTADCPSESPVERLRRVVQNTSLPKMHSVVLNAMRRSGSVRGKRADTQSIVSETTLVDTDSYISEKKRTVSGSCKSELGMLPEDDNTTSKKILRRPSL